MVNTEASTAKYIRSYKVRSICYADFLTTIVFFFPINLPLRVSYRHQILTIYIY